MPNFFRKLMVKAIFWYALPAVFLTLYVGMHHGSQDSVLAHIYILTLLFAAVALVESYIKLLLRPRSLALLFIAFMHSAIFFSLTAYYSLVIVGLRSWGKVITTELMVSYWRHAEQLFSAIGMPYHLTLVALIAIFSLIFCIFYLKYSKNKSDFFIVDRKHQAGLSGCLKLSLLAFCAYHVNGYFSASDFSSREPFRLSLYAGKPNAQSQQSAGRVNANAILDPIENSVRSSYSPSTDVQRKNVILIVVDALRPDSLGVYGYKRDTTPYLSKLATQGYLQTFKNVRSSCGESACGLASIAASRYSHQLPSNPFNLQQVLQRNGYEVHFILGGDHTNFYNLKSMYGNADSFYDGSMAKHRYMNDDLLVIEKTQKLPPWNGNPVMFQFHLMSTHTLGKQLDQYKKFEPAKSFAGNVKGVAKVEHTNHYDNGVLQADATIRQLLEVLNEKSYLKNATIVITADHGEGLGEHGFYSHGNSVYEEALRIPLLFINFDEPVKTTAKDTAIISQIDIAPSILRKLKIPAPTSWVGAAIQTDNFSDEKSKISFFHMHPYIGFYSQEMPNQLWKYWIDTNTSEEYAFNLSIDPLELRNVFWETPISVRNNWRKLAYATHMHP
jgi:glucan phosphoethanolaminetransferase (alkaline phosphatase superfamily)